MLQTTVGEGNRRAQIFFIQNGHLALSPGKLDSILRNSGKKAGKLNFGIYFY